MFVPGHLELLIILLVGLFICLGPVVAVLLVVYFATRQDQQQQPPD